MSVPIDDAQYPAPALPMPSETCSECHLSYLDICTHAMCSVSAKLCTLTPYAPCSLPVLSMRFRCSHPLASVPLTLCTLSFCILCALSLSAICLSQLTICNLLSEFTIRSGVCMCTHYLVAAHRPVVVLHDNFGDRLNRVLLLSCEHLFALIRESRKAVSFSNLNLDS